MKTGKNNEREIEDIAKIIQNDNQSTAIFKAVKQIKHPTVENNIIVYNDKGETITNKTDKYNAVKNYFKNKFWKEENERIKAFKGKQRPVNVPVSKDEVVGKQLESWKIIKHQEKIELQAN